MDPRIADIEKEYRRDDLPAFAPGDTVRVRVRVVEGDKERIQPFEGVCIARRGSGLSETFTLRRVSGGVGVERIFPLQSPAIASLEVVRRGDVRRAKLYYLRARRGKRARVRERRWWLDGPEGAGPVSEELLQEELSDQMASVEAAAEEDTPVDEELASGEAEAGGAAATEAQPETEADAEAGPRGRRETADTAAAE